jgi:hypothetical protein
MRRWTIQVAMDRLYFHQNGQTNKKRPAR